MSLQSVCVLGAGIMGAGIAQVAAQAGLQVCLRDIQDDFPEIAPRTVLPPRGHCGPGYIMILRLVCRQSR
jgi:2-polyprenyl-6-methoxyphenol hydroxylase-like FAD-dependent oxidoreductase